ncbi:hypothetical protein DFH06DRAFT_1305184 [Mycena polygramma]|nr:hypothetical protein DFH06DRAFT_1305184 [Mycena polygramma]
MQAKTHPFDPVLVESLGKPMANSSCCIFGITSALTQINLASCGDKSLHRSSSFLRVAMRFMCDRKSDQEYARLREKLLVCHCNLQNRIMSDLHRRYKPSIAASEAFECALTFICTYLSDVLCLQRPGKFLKLKKNAQPERQPWPSKVEDILPNGASAAEVLDTLLRWAVEPGYGSAVFGLLPELARFWEPFAAELMGRPAAFLLATQHLQHAADTYYPQAPNSWQCPAAVSTCATFFTRILQIESRGLVHIVLPLMDKMDAIRLRIAPILDSQDWMEDARAWFDQVRRMAVPNRPGNCDPIGDIAIGSCAEPLNHLEEIYLSTFFAIWELRNRNQCMHLECTTPMAKPSAVCRGCGVVRYCSRECQKAAWKNDPVLAHKALCLQIRRLRGGLEMTHDGAWEGLVVDPGTSCSPSRSASSFSATRNTTSPMPPRIASSHTSVKHLSAVYTCSHRI